MKPIIGIIARVEYPGKTHKLAMNEPVRRKIIEYGGNPILILPPQNIDYTEVSYNDQQELTKEEKEMIIEQIKLCNGIIMSGGFKINKFDRFIAEYVTDNDIPLLGICLGMQIMANYKKDLWIEKNNSFIEHRVEEGLVHNVTLDKSSMLYKIVDKDKFMVNSRHYYHVLPNDYYSISSVSDDNYIESIEMKDKKFNIGVQWHPENMDDDTSDKLFKKFIEVCSNNLKI